MTLTYNSRALVALAMLATVGGIPLAEAAPPKRTRRLGAPNTIREPATPDEPPAPRVHDAERMAEAEAKRARKNAKRAKLVQP